MRDLDECKAEIFRRMENGIKERKRRINRILTCCVPLCLCLAVWSVNLLLANTPMGANLNKQSLTNSLAGESAETGKYLDGVLGATYDGADGNETAGNDNPTEPSLLTQVVDTPYAVVEIVEITDETICLYPNGDSENYVKVKCRILQSYHTESFDDTRDRFADGISMDGNATDEYGSGGFDFTEELYFTEKTKLKESDVIFIQVRETNLNERFYYGAVTNDEGFSEYLVFADGKLQMKSRDYSTESFEPIWLLNREIKYAKKHLYDGKEDDFLQAFPEGYFGDGMTVEKISEYFGAWDKAIAIRDSVK